jgi:cell division transport system permease protein
MYLKTALSNIRRSPFQAVAAILVLAVTFFVGTLIAVLVYSSAQVLNHLETSPRVIVFIKSDTKQEDINALQEKLKNNSQISDLQFVTKEEALTIYKDATSDNPLLGQLVSPSIFPSSLEFSVNQIENTQKVIDDVKKEPIVDSVGFTASLGDEAASKKAIERLSRITFYIRIGGLILGVILSMTSFLVLIVIVGMRIANKKGEMETLKLMGATGGFIKMPIIIEAIVYVTFGVLIGWFLAFVLILYATPTILNFFVSIPVLPQDTGSFVQLNLIILFCELVVGFIIATLGGMIAVTKASK